MYSNFMNNIILISAYAGASIAMCMVGFFWFDKVMTRRFSLKKALYDDDNQAAGQLVAQYLLALVLIICASHVGDSSGKMTLGQELGLAASYFGVGLVLMTIIRFVYVYILNVMMKVDVDDEVFEQKNNAAAKLEGAIYLAIGVILAISIY